MKSSYWSSTSSVSDLSEDGRARLTQFLARVDLPPGPTPGDRIKAFIDEGQQGPALKVENVTYPTRASACKAALAMLPTFLLMVPGGAVAPPAGGAVALPGGAVAPPPTLTDEQVLPPILAVIQKHKKPADSESAKKYNQCLAQTIGSTLGFLAETAMQQLIAVTLDIALDSPLSMSPKTEFSAERIFKALLSYAAAGILITNASDWLIERLEATRCAEVFATLAPPALGGGEGAGGIPTTKISVAVKRPALTVANTSDIKKQAAEFEPAAFSSWPPDTPVRRFDKSRGCIYCGNKACPKHDGCRRSPTGGRTKFYECPIKKSTTVGELMKQGTKEAGGGSA